MIAYLSGKIKFLFDDACIIDVHGVGYKVFVDANTRQALTLDAPTELFIHTAVREDAINLFGMKDQSTFALFELLLTVSGVGAKVALAIVSKISAAEFSRAVAAQDLKALTRLPGVGKKSAERILLELKDKVRDKGQGTRDKVDSTAFEDAAEALEALGYTAAEISAAFDNAPKNFSTEQLIKFALKNFSGR